MTEEETNAISLRTYFDSRINALEKQLEIALRANAVAIQKAEDAVNTRLAGMNEFRASLSDQSARQATKEEVNMLRSILYDRIEALRNSHDEKIQALQRITYIGMGAIFILQFMINAGLFTWGQ